MATLKIMDILRASIFAKDLLQKNISGVLHHKPPTDAILLSLSYFMFSLYVNIHSISALAESSLRAHNYIAHFLFLG